MMDEEGQPPRKRRIGSGGRRILSPETKRRNEIATRLKYRALNRSAIKSRHRAEVVVKLSAAVSRRWIALQDRLECADKNALATLLMDSYEAHESRNTQSELPGPSGVQLLTSTPTQGSSSLALRYVAKWSKRSKDYVAMKDRVDKTYAYIPGMMAAILEMRFEDHQPLNVRPVMRMDDPRRIAPRLAPKAPPTTASILQRRGISRFGVPENEQQ
ncbi:uncharacterized protein LOC119741628 [Patiria miniata]|uniref:Uncharacterized protein n=1 Tax=Patiria miniata TaxID=46514 RepID=A0A914BB05_PATMI|nr:uncharacterized protein LOC119741628 [Patiria miniata]